MPDRLRHGHALFDQWLDGMFQKMDADMEEAGKPSGRAPAPGDEPKTALADLKEDAREKTDDEGRS